MRRWIGFLGSWALLILALGLTSLAVAGEVINARDLRRLNRVSVIDRMIAERLGNKTATLRESAARKSAHVNALQARLQVAAAQTEDVPDTGETIIVSTAENKLYVRNGGRTIFEAVCSTGKGTTLALDGRTLVFDTPIGKLHVVSKEENPQWVPPDWHYVEQARKNGMRVVHLNAGDAIDAATGQPAQKRDSGFWSFLRGGSSGSSRVLRVRGDTVIEDDRGVVRELPPGKLIAAGDAVIIPPVNTKQRHFDKVLGHYRLNLGDGYAIHGTQETDKLGQSVSHGCVRLGDDDIARLYAMANVGDAVIIY
jgi:lipoprotein-anchoring transpeptidase ErfK/SrfK